MLEAIGGFDTRYFMYFEDVDLSWRAPRAGWRVVYTPRSSLRHVHAGTSREGSPLWVFFVTRNRLFFLVKHGTARAAVREVLRFYARAGHRAARWLLRRGAAAPATELRVAQSLARHLPGLLVSRYRGGMDQRWTAVTPPARASS
jgi:GT2 family glycosyltransferase